MLQKLLPPTILYRSKRNPIIGNSIKPMLHFYNFRPLGASLCLLFIMRIGGVASGQNKKIYQKGWIDLNKNGKKDVYEDPSKTLEARINDLVNQMTLEEKTCQMATIYGWKRVLKD